MNGTGTQKTIKMMKHYHLDPSKSWRDGYFETELRRLDPQLGECFALFCGKDHLVALVHIKSKEPGYISCFYR